MMRQWKYSKEPSVKELSDPKAYLMEAEAMGTRYALIGFPFKKWNIGYFGEGYLILDPHQKRGYVFRSYVSWDYLSEKWNKGGEVVSQADAQALSDMANRLIAHIEEQSNK